MQGELDTFAAMFASRPQLSNWTILLVLAFTWGSSFILMKRGLLSFPPQQVAALRIFIAFIFLSPLAIRNLMPIWRSGRWKAVFAVGFFGNLIPAFLFTKAQMGLSSSLTGMLNSLTPLFTLIMGIWFFKSLVSSTNIVGVLVGLVGAAGLIMADESGTMYGSFSFAFYVLLATILYALSVNIIKKYLQEIDSVHIASVALFLVGIPAGIYLFTTDFTTRISTIEGAGWSLLYVALLAIFGTALAVILFNVLIKRTNALFASSVTYLIPVFAMLWGIADGERINLIQLFCVLLILGGVYLVNLRKLAR